MSETDLQELIREALEAARSARDADAAEEVRLRFLGRKNGLLTEVMRGLKDLSPEEKRTVGPLANMVKTFLEDWASATKQSDVIARARAYQDFYQFVQRQKQSQEIQAILKEEWDKAEAGEKELETGPRIDLTVPGRRPRRGHRHPIVQTMDEIISVLTRLGYSVAEGPEVELDYYNFEALNIPKDHPARDMQDTFYISDDVLLRTHTSPVQIRIMEKQPPPVKVIAPGKVFRCDADVTHSPMFHQVEGLYVDRGVSFTDLKGTLQAFVEALFGPEFRVRLRPSFFPFTEPSAEVDISCEWMNGGEWMEVLGAGMVDPAVLEAVGYDPEVWSGFAWGLGVERVAMLRYGISDIRLFFENDIRMLRQF